MLASSPPTGKCVGCHKPVPELYHCPVCHKWVCPSCTKNASPGPQHSGYDHLMEYDDTDYDSWR
jgi:hypothetical protein